MKNPRLIAIQKFMTLHDCAVAEADVQSLLARVMDLPEALYENGDFVKFYYGMGEMGYGEVVSKGSKHYMVQPYYKLKPQDHPTRVGDGDMRGLATPEDGAEYDRERGGEQ